MECLVTAEPRTESTNTALLQSKPVITQIFFFGFAKEVN